MYIACFNWSFANEIKLYTDLGMIQWEHAEHHSWWMSVPILTNFKRLHKAPGGFCKSIFCTKIHLTMTKLADDLDIFSFLFYCSICPCYYHINTSALDSVPHFASGLSI